MKDAAKCPRCGAPDKYPNKPKTYYHNKDLRVAPTTYECGTVTSPNWSPPIYGKKCGKEQGK